MKYKVLTTILLTHSLLTTPAYAEMGSGHMNSNFIQMENMMDKAESTQSDKKRKQYLNNHMSMMMQNMEGMSGMMSQHHKMDNEEMNNTEMMHKRMDMMQMMMKHMMRQQNMMMDTMETKD